MRGFLLPEFVRIGSEFHTHANDGFLEKIPVGRRSFIDQGKRAIVEQMYVALGRWLKLPWIE
jgi:hypothetical protein